MRMGTERTNQSRRGLKIGRSLAKSADEPPVWPETVTGGK
jgi:hypothetical protein